MYAIVHLLIIFHPTGKKKIVLAARILTLTDFQPNIASKEAFDRKEIIQERYRKITLIGGMDVHWPRK
ncbi:hypothetical protein IFO69_10185 [Echinicola sp. CAU 1574]|uniref:Uncharacterized protein n=1 Tax=Echinicola arenosa TaxID=2774144 RepID=A0ABR9AJZ0_9BACT|nr:hypothetical protein [Echinicola arenosa]MBD8489113.1 hypothetical protein [Echinicola arenosa]